MKYYDVFISYRRKGGFETAKHLYDLLSIDGYSVAFDINTIRNGRFDEKINELITQCRYFIIILDKNVFHRTKNPFFRKSHDWVRLELKEALQQKKIIIPVYLPGFSFPHHLPKDIDEIRLINGIKYAQDYFDEFYSKVKERLNVTHNFKHIDIIKAAFRAGVYTMVGYTAHKLPSQNTNLLESLEILDIPTDEICNDAFISEGQVDINMLAKSITQRYGLSVSEYAAFGFILICLGLAKGTPKEEEQKTKFMDSGITLGIPANLLEKMADAPSTDILSTMNSFYIYLENKFCHQ